MTIDVDVGGAKASARAIERAGHMMAEGNKAAHAMHMKTASEAVAKAEVLRVSAYFGRS
jgi:N-acetylglucosamine kinase-like BadF-type ATPase